MAFKIITDATADISSEMFLGIEAPLLIPMEVAIDGESQLYGVAEGLTMDSFFEAQRANKEVKTSQINPYSYEEFFTKVLEEGFDILYLCFSSGLSASYNNALSVQEKLKEKFPDRKIVIVDTLSAATGEALIVLEACRLKAQGQTLEEIADFVETHRLTMMHWFTVDDLKYLKKGGRISSTTAFVGSLLNIKPVMNVDNTGHLVAKAKAIGMKMALKSLQRRFEEEFVETETKTVIIGHTEALDNAREMEKAILKKCPSAKTYIVTVGPVIAAHTGPGLIVISYWGSKRV